MEDRTEGLLNVPITITATDLLYYCPSCDRRLLLLQPCSHIQISPAALETLKARILELETGARNVSGVPVLPSDRELLQLQAQKICRATALLARCEPFLPSDLIALLRDVREFLGIDARGFRDVQQNSCPGERAPTDK